jgi:hypothetical protein
MGKAPLLDRQLPVFPYATTTPVGWDHSATGWVALTIAATVVLGVVLADARGGGCPSQCRIIDAECPAGCAGDNATLMLLPGGTWALTSLPDVPTHATGAPLKTRVCSRPSCGWTPAVHERIVVVTMASERS